MEMASGNQHKKENRTTQVIDEKHMFFFSKLNRIINVLYTVCSIDTEIIQN